MKKPEQVERHSHSYGSKSYRAYLKHEGRRTMRRAGKRMLDDASKRLPLRGYEE